MNYEWRVSSFIVVAEPGICGNEVADSSDVIEPQHYVHLVYI